VVEIINYCSSRVSENIHIGCSSPSTVPSLWAAVAVVRPAQRILACLTLRACHRQGPVDQDPFQILLHIRRLMPRLPPRLHGILAQFPDINCPSVRHSHAQYQAGHHHPYPTILMPEAHRAQWSLLLNKASCYSCLRSCDFPSLASSFFSPHYPSIVPRSASPTGIDSRDCFGRFRKLPINRSPPPRHFISLPLLALHTWRLRSAEPH